MYTIDTKIAALMENHQAAAVLEEILPGMGKKTAAQPVMAGMSLRRLAEYSKGAISDQVLAALEERLAGILQDGETDREKSGRLKQLPLTPDAAERIQEPVRTAICPGKVWRDTEGKRIQAHAGALYYEDGHYYWYGENKEKTDGVNSIWTYGIRLYSSEDLCSWKDEGFLIPPNLEDSSSNLWPEKYVDRPHILKCPATGKYVCWLKLSGDDACFAILEADSFRGPYRMVMENYRPFGRKAGDFDLAAEESGRAFLFLDGDHEGIFCMELSGDYLRAEREVSRQYEGLHAPFCREGIAVFEHDGKKYMFTSGMSGYIPNESDSAWSDSWERPFVSLGNPHVSDESGASFNSQISQVFRVPGKKELYIALADRWVPDYPVDERRADLLARAIASHYDPEHYRVTEQEKRELAESPMLKSANTSRADYVWLPVVFREGRPFLEWKESWSPSDYE